MVVVVEAVQVPSDAVASALSKPAVFLGVVRRAGPHVIEASLIPTVLFYVSLGLFGLGAALVTVLLWVYLAVIQRVVRSRDIPPLLVLAVVGITGRTAVAMSSGSTFLYFAQPIVGSIAMGCVFLCSIAIGRPLVARLALEFWPLTQEMLVHPMVARLLRRLTYLWAAVNLLIGGTTLVLLLALPTPAYLAVKQVTSLAIMALGIAITIDRAVHTARREGFLTNPPKAPRPAPSR